MLSERCFRQSPSRPRRARPHGERALAQGVRRFVFLALGCAAMARRYSGISWRSTSRSFVSVIGPSLRDRYCFNASFIIGGQIVGEPIRLFRTFAEGNFIEAGTDTPFLQTGETKYGKPILDRVVTRRTPLADATKCVLVSFDSTMRSNLSVGMPIDLICYERDSLEVRWRRRFEEGDPYFTTLSDGWGEGVRQAFRHLPELQW